MGISSKLPVKNEIKNETYAPAMYATVKRNSVKPSAENGEKSHRISVIGIEAPDLKVGEEIHTESVEKDLPRLRYSVSWQWVSSRNLG